MPLEVTAGKTWREALPAGAQLGDIKEAGSTVGGGKVLMRAPLPNSRPAV